MSVHLARLCRPWVLEGVDKLTASLMKASTKSVLTNLKFFFLITKCIIDRLNIVTFFHSPDLFSNPAFRAVVLGGTSESDLDHLTMDAKTGPFIKCKGKVHPGIRQESP